jgi:ABC-2 type transport system ATP-binding protein
MIDMNAMIEVSNLTKRYGRVTAVDDISFTVARGEIFGLLGHNGAGKSTTIRLLTGRSAPESGSISVAGFDLAHDYQRVKPIISVVFEDQNHYERFSGLDNLRIFADLYEVPRSRADELLEMVGLTDARKRKVKTYSTGMKQRLMIARALINKPAVLFLDEPTRGLDPTSARELRTLIAGLSDAGTTVVLTTHYMEEADDLCNRVAFLSQGRIVALDTPRELKLGRGTSTARITLRNREEIELDLNDPDSGQKLAALIDAGDVIAVHSQEGTLEDVFIDLAGRPL